MPGSYHRSSNRRSACETKLIHSTIWKRPNWKAFVGLPLPEITPLGGNRVFKGTMDGVAAGVTNSSSSNDAKGMATVDSNLEWSAPAQRVPVRIHLDEQQGNLWPAAQPRR